MLTGNSLYIILVLILYQNSAIFVRGERSGFTKSFLKGLQKLSKSESENPFQGYCSHNLSNHPVVKTILERRESLIKNGNDYLDHRKVGLVIEGGAMRGCIAVGATTALHYLGLRDTVDAVYGSSAGAIVGAYFVSEQIKECKIFETILSRSKFINKLNILRTPFPKLLNSRKHATLNIDKLLEDMLCENTTYCFDWKAFQNNEQKLKLNIITSNIRNFTSIVLNRENGSYKNMAEFKMCLRASMLLPGVTGDLMCLRDSERTPMRYEEAMSHRNIIQRIHDRDDNRNGDSEVLYTPIADAYLTEPIPYKSAIQDGCTHIIVIRTRPDSKHIRLTRNRIVRQLEKVIIKNYFTPYNESQAVEYVNTRVHHKIYEQDILTLNDACHFPLSVSVAGGGPGPSARSTRKPSLANSPCTVEMSQIESAFLNDNDGDAYGIGDDTADTASGNVYQNTDIGDRGDLEMVVHVLPIAPRYGCEEVRQLETNRDKLTQGMRDGALRVLEIFGEGVGIERGDFENHLHIMFPFASKS